MKNKAIFAFAALALFASAILFPLTVIAAGGSDDKTPPTLTAELKDGTLRVEAKDEDSGVEAVFVDSNRINTLVNGKAEVLLKDYAENNKQVSVYAVDFAGNRSETKKFDNPYYKAPVPLVPPASSSSAPTSPSQSQAPASSSSQPQPASSSSSSVSSSSSSDTSVSSTSSSSTVGTSETEFTPPGGGTVLDHATDADGKEFYTILTADGNVFYLIIDRQRGSENVYFLNVVTEADLVALAEKNGGSIPPTSTLEPQSQAPTSSSDVTSVPEPTPAKNDGGNTGTIIFILIATLAAGGAGYYFKVLRPKQQASLMDDDGFDESDGDDYDAENYTEEYDLENEPAPDYDDEDDFEEE